MDAETTVESKILGQKWLRIGNVVVHMNLLGRQESCAAAAAVSPDPCSQCLDVVNAIEVAHAELTGLHLEIQDMHVLRNDLFAERKQNKEQHQQANHCKNDDQHNGEFATTATIALAVAAFVTAATRGKAPKATSAVVAAMVVM